MQEVIHLRCSRLQIMPNWLSFTACVAVGATLAACSAKTVSPGDDQALSPLSSSSRASAAPQSGDLTPAIVGVPTDPLGESHHVITPGDVLEISVFQADELSTRERVNDFGSVALPLVGAVPVAGLTTSGAEGRIADALGGDYLQDPQVNVFVTDFADLEVSVGGEVNEPGVFPIRGRTTLLEGIALAGGTTRRAKETQVIVFRSKPASKTIDAYVVDLRKVQRGELRDPLLAANDKIVVPRSGSRVFLEDVRDTLRGFVTLNPLLY
jgi:polysaccharide export outer membrane protein